MKPWVVQYLKKLGDDRISPESLEAELSIPTLCYLRLAKLFKIGFSINERKLEIFGSVLSDLPFEVFEKLRSFKNLVFVWPARNISTVERYCFAEKNSEMIVVTFPDSVSEHSYLTQRGVIAHEIAHVIREDFLNLDRLTFTEREKGVDALMKKWNFDEELKLIDRGDSEDE